MQERPVPYLPISLAFSIRPGHIIVLRIRKTSGKWNLHQRWRKCDQLERYIWLHVANISYFLFAILANLFIRIVSIYVYEREKCSFYTSLSIIIFYLFHLKFALCKFIKMSKSISNFVVSYFIWYFCRIIVNKHCLIQRPIPLTSPSVIPPIAQ